MASIRQKPSGRWEVRYRDPDGKMRGKTFPNKTDAKAFKSRTEADLQRGQWLDPAVLSTPFEDWASDWLRTRGHRKPSTLRSYEGLLNNHVLPVFGKRPIGSIGHKDVLMFRADLMAKGAGIGTVNNAMAALRAVLNLAVQS